MLSFIVGKQHYPLHSPPPHRKKIVKSDLPPRLRTSWALRFPLCLPVFSSCITPNFHLKALLNFEIEQGPSPTKEASIDYSEKAPVSHRKWHPLHLIIYQFVTHLTLLLNALFNFKCLGVVFLMHL